MRQLTAAEAAARLGVKRETLYAYVSRGVLTSTRQAGGRGSVFDAAEVEAIAERTRRGGRAGALEVVVASGLTLIEDDRLSYRGVDVAELATTTTFESVAEWLWGGEPAVLDACPQWPDAPATVADTGDYAVVDRLRRIVAAAGSADPLRYDLDPRSVADVGRRLLATMVDGLPVRSGAKPGPVRARTTAAGGTIAARLTPRLGRVKAVTPELQQAVNAALVLLADHELAASTFAARVAASVRADPYSVVSAGLGVIAGALHGAAAEPVVGLLDEIGTPARVPVVVGERLRRRELLPGVGHKVYRHVDPRADVLLALGRTLPARVRDWDVVEALAALIRDRIPAVLSVDFALGSLVWAAGLDASAGETIFAVARTAGWIAHAMEEYGEEPLRFRPRAAYIGPRQVSREPPRRSGSPGRSR